MTKHTILFLAANPSGTGELALGTEARAIRVELKRSGFRDRFKLEPWWATEPLDLIRGLRELKPTVVHFSGHGGRRAPGAPRSAPTLRRDLDDLGDLGPEDVDQHPGLLFQNSDGRPQVVSATALRDAFGAAGASVKLVVLNACYSEPAAHALLAHVDCVVGVAGAIRDDAAKSFAIGFYGGLGERESVEAAYKQGCAAIGMEGLPASIRPQLLVRPGVDARALILAAPIPVKSRKITSPRPPPSTHRSTVKSTAGEPSFTGRGAELEKIEDRFRAQNIVVIHGVPGLGKSRLAKEYAHKHARIYPGGMYFVPFDQTPPIALAKLLRDWGSPAYENESFEDQCRRALHAVGSAGRALLIYDATADERTLRDWLPFEELDCHLIVTSTSAKWANSWSTVELAPLQPAAACELAASILGDDAAARSLAASIATEDGEITIELCARAAAAREHLRRGRIGGRISTGLSTETTSSFEAAWMLLSPDAQLLLQVASTFATSDVPALLVASTLQGLGWTPHTADDAIDDACDRKLAVYDEKNLQIHRLVAKFARARAPVGEVALRSLFRGLLRIAREFSEHPGDLDYRASMLAHSLHVEDWAALVTDSSEWHVVGDAIVELGKFAEALPWFERAVAAKENGDVHGRVDSGSLGESLHQVGSCYASRGKFAEALPWSERAVAAKENGDVHGRVDSGSLGRSLHQVGECYSSQGKFAEALPWFRRAVAAAENGDVYGRVDSVSLGGSLHQVGSCYASQGEFAEALPWYERAVVTAEKGDVHGRVDSGSLGVSLHLVGYCYSRQGKFAEALPWYERAVAAAENGDVHGRVDSGSLGRSLHQVGYCYSSQDQLAEALPWFQRAVAATEKGDVYGRVDSGSLGRNLHQVGDCYSRQGKFAEALPWFERAAAAKESGDVHGRVDHGSLGKSLHEVGSCYLRQGKFAEALPRFQRAVAAKESGDVHGRVDSESLGRSLSQVGYCHSGQGKFAEALPWFQRAVAAKESGDVHGRVDSESLGRSLSQVGTCYENMGNFAEARQWFERAVACGAQ